MVAKADKKVKKRISRSDKLFYFLNAAFLVLCFLFVIYPLIYVVSASFSSPVDVARGRVILLPKNFSLEGYRKILSYKKILTGYINSIIYTGVGTFLGVIMTCLCAYPLSRRNLVGRRWLTLLYIIPMYFSGGMIPSYLLINQLGLYNTRAAVILPLVLAPFNVLVACSFFRSNIPEELYEYAQIDGCSDFRFFLSIALPLSSTILAVLTLFYAIRYWNNFFYAFMYLTRPDLFPLQVVLREILNATKLADLMMDSGGIVSAAAAAEEANMFELMKYCVIVVASLPIVCLYPFIQRHFVKGVMIGSIKG